MQGTTKKITVTQSASQERCAFFNYFQKVLDIPQKCGIIRIQKEHSKNTEQKQERYRMKITIKIYN